MNRLEHKRANQTVRKQRVRASVSGTSARPRLSIHVSNRNVSAQIIDDTTGKTLVASSTVHAKEKLETMTDKCAFVGADVAKKAVKAKITQVVFDRSGHSYQRRLSALAGAARENGLEF